MHERGGLPDERGDDCEHDESQDADYQEMGHVYCQSLREEAL